MNSAIALGIRPVEIPDQLAGFQRAMTIKALMGQGEAQEFQLGQARKKAGEEEAITTALRSSGGDFNVAARALLQGGHHAAAAALQKVANESMKAGLDVQESKGKVTAQQWDLTAKLVGSVLNAKPQNRPTVYAQARQVGIQAGIPGAEQYPEQFSPDLIPQLEAELSRALSAADLREGASYRSLAGLEGQPDQTPAVAQGTAPSPAYSALSATTVDPISGAIVSTPNLTQPVGSPIAAPLMKPQGPQTGTGWMGAGGVQPSSRSIEQGLPAQEADFQSQLVATGQAIAPTVEITKKRPQITPDDLRKQAAAARAKGTKQGFDLAKDYEAGANKLDDRFAREFNQAEQIRVREEAMALRKSNQGNQAKVNASKLGDDFRQEPAVKDYRTTLPLIASLENALAVNTAGSDLDMVYAIAKLFDPGSVVREGEQIIIRGTGGLPSTVQNALGFVIGGQRLSSQLRQELVDQAHSRFENYKQAYDSAAQSYRDQAKRWGINPDDVVRDYKVQSRVTKGQGPRRRESDKNPPKVIKWEDLQ